MKYPPSSIFDGLPVVDWFCWLIKTHLPFSLFFSYSFFSYLLFSLFFHTLFFILAILAFFSYELGNGTHAKQYEQPCCTEWIVCDRAQEKLYYSYYIKSNFESNFLQCWSFKLKIYDGPSHVAADIVLTWLRNVALCRCQAGNPLL